MWEEKLFVQPCGVDPRNIILSCKFLFTYHCYFPVTIVIISTIYCYWVFKIILNEPDYPCPYEVIPQELL